MQIVINIPEEVYEEIQTKFLNTKVNNITLTDRAIYNGTPLPKGHGDLKDAEKLKNAFIAWSVAVHGSFTDADIASIVYNSPTIIAADKEMKYADDN